jgi:predicted RND superfamily exporter protein
VRAALEAARLEPLGVSAGLTGMPAYAIEDRQIIERDITRLSWIGALVVAFLVIFAFGSWRQPLSALFALCWTVAATAGVASLYPGHLTLLSAFFASILLGTGIDFGIHILDRMGEKRTTGLDMKRAAVEAVNELEPALLTGAGTTAGAFFAMQASGFQGFAELGFIAGAGVLLCLGAMVTVLPAQLALIEARGDAVRRWYPRRGSAGVRRFVAVLLALGVLASLAVPAPPFDSDYLNLQPEGSEAVRLERELVARTDYSPLFAVFLVENTEALGDLLWRLADEETVGKVRSLHDLELGGAMLEMTEEQRAAFVTPAGHLAVYAFPAGNVWQPEERDAFLARMRSIDPEVTGMPFLGELMISRSQRALRRTTALAALILCLLVGLSLRRPMAALLAAAPAIATFFAMHALMRVLGIAYNPLDIMALPVVLGLAVDDGVHLVHRFLAEGGNLERTLAGSGRSVLLTSLTTLAAFGCLTFTSHRGLGSFALVLCLGVTCALALSLLLLPEVLHLLRHRLLDDAGTPGRR